VPFRAVRKLTLFIAPIKFVLEIIETIYTYPSIVVYSGIALVHILIIKGKFLTTKFAMVVIPILSIRLILMKNQC
jgi:hypothetical protein